MINLVADFGADPNGVLDTSPILNLALSSSKEEIYIPAGNYKFLSTVYLPEQKDIRIFGAGFRKTYLHYGGLGGQAALWFRSCQDVYTDTCFISSNQSTTRMGVFFDSCHSFGLSKCTVVNNSRGIQINPPSFGMSNKATITGNKFEANAFNHILLYGGVEGVKITENHFQTQTPRSGSQYEIYGNISGVNNNIVAFNTFAGSSYPLVLGPNSVVTGNIFNVKP